MKTITQPRPCIPSVLLALNLVHVVLCINGCQVKHGVCVGNGLNGFFGVNGLGGVERHHHSLREGQGLQFVQ